MDKEIRWILKKLSANEISAQSADRLIRALKLLNKSADEDILPTDSSKNAEQVSTEKVPQAKHETISAIIEPPPPEKLEIVDQEEVKETQEDELEEEAEESFPVEIEEELEHAAFQQEAPLMEEQEAEEILPEIIPEIIETEETIDEAETVEPESINKMPLLNEIGTGFIEGIPNGTKLSLEKSGNIIIQGWDESYLRAEGKGKPASFRLDEDLLIIEDDGEDQLTLYVPSSIVNISVMSVLSLIGVRNYSGDIFVNSDTGNIEITDVTGNVNLKMETGSVYIGARNLDNVNVDLAEGKAELNLEEPNSDAAAQICVLKGNITVGLPPSFGCDLVAQGSRKRMYIELPVEVIEKGKDLLRGKLSGGGPKLELFAPDGEIRLQALGLLNAKDNTGKIASGTGIL